MVALLVALLGGTAQAQDTLQVLPGDTAPLTLEECVSAALAHNGSLRAEQIRTGEVRAQITQTLSEGFPTVDVSGSWNRSRDPSFALDETFGGGGGAGSDTGGLDTLFTGLIPAPADIAAQTFWRASVNASWEIRPGRIYNALKAVGSGIAQQEDVVTETEHRVAEETLRAFSNVLLAGERERALLQEAEARRELLAVARRRFRVELGTPLDTLQAAVSLANLSPEIRRAHQDLEDAGA
ncbi:MAG: TolC family protein, partial [Candidatus Eisenbacteria bacterium]|nr:TolC family protein [Candidatus Eisenbacteria bacterium]